MPAARRARRLAGLNGIHLRLLRLMRLVLHDGVMVRTHVSQVEAELNGFIEAAREAVDAGAVMRLVVNGRERDIPARVAQVILDVVESSEDSVVQLNVLDPEMTTGQAADFLHVSRPTVVEWVDSGRLPARKIGTHRRIKTADVARFADSLKMDRREALRELTRLSQETGLYSRDS